MYLDIHETDNMTIHINDHENDGTIPYVALTIICDDGRMTFFFKTLEDVIGMHDKMTVAIIDTQEEREYPSEPEER